MDKSISAADFVPQQARSLAALKRAAAMCEGCHLYKHATQTVFGDGVKQARLMLVGEQPGDSEDRLGRPFVGPAGRLLRELMAKAGIAEEDVYVTNAVKHFGFQEKGEHRIHSKPRIIDIDSCGAWLEAEVRIMQPHLIICLGVSASYAVLGKKVTISKVRGGVLKSRFDTDALVTMHPSAILRMRDGDDRHRAQDNLIKDLSMARRLLQA